MNYIGYKVSYSIEDEEDQPRRDSEWTDNSYDGKWKWKDEIASDYGYGYHKVPSKTIYIISLGH